jgi:geranylgeranyl reductase family protein
VSESISPADGVLRGPMTLDVAIVGAGPAGTAAALALAGRGLHVAIIEKEIPPRYKTCGGGILSRAARLLPVDIASAVERQCFAVELFHHRPNLRFAVQRDFPVISMVMRDHFDQLLTNTAQQAGTLILAGTPVLDVTPRENNVELNTSAGLINARFVIAADGAGSVVARKTGAVPLRRVIPALECEVALEAPLLERFTRTARFDFGLVPGGYAWVFPKQKHLSIGVLTTRRGEVNLHDCYRQYLESLAIPQPLRAERHGYMIPTRPRDDALEVRRVLFVGDAAGLADPVTAEGITAAILSGQLAAQAILEGACDELAVKKAYRAALRARLLPELRAARFMARVLYDFPRLWTALLSRHGQGICELVTDVVTGAATYSDVVRQPGNYLKLLRWRRPNS